MSKQYSISILLIIIIGLSACGNNAVHSSSLEPDGGSSAPVESSVQEEVNSVPVEPSVQEQIVEDEAEIEYITRQVNSDIVLAFRKDGKYGLISSDLQEIITEAVYDRIDSFSEGLASAKIGQSFFYLNEDGVVVIELGDRFSSVGRFYDGLAQIETDTVDAEVTKNNTNGFLNQGGYPYFGYIDKTGEIVIPVQFMSHGWWMFMSDTELSEKYGSGSALTFWSDRGTQIVMDASRDYLWGVIDRQGNFVIDPIYSWVSSFHDGLAMASIKDGRGFINEYGEVVIDFSFDGVQNFSNGLAAVVVDGKYGYVDRQGEWVITPQYNAAFPFNGEGYAVIMPVYLDVLDFKKIEHASEGTFGYYDVDYYIFNYLIIDRTGQTVFSAEQLIMTDSRPDTSAIMRRFLDDPQRTTAEYSGTPHRQTFENMVVVSPYIGISNAKDNDEGFLEITHEHPPLDVIKIDVQ